MNRDQVENGQNACNLALRDVFVTGGSGLGGAGSEDGSLRFGKLLLQLNSLIKLADKSLLERDFFAGHDVIASIRETIRARKLETHLQVYRNYHQQSPLSVYSSYQAENNLGNFLQQQLAHHHQMLAFHSTLMRLNHQVTAQQQQITSPNISSTTASELAARLNEHFIRLSSSSSSITSSPTSPSPYNNLTSQFFSSSSKSTSSSS